MRRARSLAFFSILFFLPSVGEAAFWSNWKWPSFSSKVEPIMPAVWFELHVELPGSEFAEKSDEAAQIFLREYNRLARAMKTVPGPHFFNWEAGPAQQIRQKAVRFLLVSKHDPDFEKFYQKVPHPLTLQHGFNIDVQYEPDLPLTPYVLNVYFFSEDFLLREQRNICYAPKMGTLSVLARAIAGPVRGFLEQLNVGELLQSERRVGSYVTETRIAHDAAIMLEAIYNNPKLWNKDDIGEEMLDRTIVGLRGMGRLYDECAKVTRAAANN